MRTLLSLMAGAIVLIVGCGSSDQPQGYSPELKQDFIGECTDAGSTEETCGCMYDMVEAEIPFERFKEIEEGMRAGEMPIPAEIEKFAVDCAAAADSTSG